MEYTVLLVEDDAGNRDLATYAFGTACSDGMLSLARTADEALAYLRGDGAFSDRSRHPLPRLVLLDLRLAGRSGFDVLRWIRSQARLSRLAVIMLAGSDAQTEVDQAYALGANSYLVKPADIDGWLSLMRGISQFAQLLPQEAAP